MARDDRLTTTEDPSVDDTRTEAQRDRDRILYSSAFRRLGGVTQVVSASEGLIIHNRLTHTLKVAQVARRVAERQLHKAKTDQALQKTIEVIGGLDPDVAEAAALAHDLGHPPFGHIAEDELRELAADETVVGKAGALTDSFEGNAQSFRIVARQSVRTFHYSGLNLTRATLNAILKYPWRRGEGPNEKRDRKWGAYQSEQDVFEFARADSKPFVRSVEAEIMDWADDIAYALHDTEDFYRAGLIPLDRLVVKRDDEERNAFLEYYVKEKKIVDPVLKKRADQDLANAIGSLAPRDRYTGSMLQRSTLRSWISNRIGEYVHAFSLTIPKTEDGSVVTIAPRALREIDLLKQLTWYYVIRNPALATQQAGQRRLIGTLFKIFCEAARKGDDDLLPRVFIDRLRVLRDEAKMSDDDKQRGMTRLIVDLIASMTEEQALRIHHKLVGVSPGSVMDQLLHQSIG